MIKKSNKILRIRESFGDCITKLICTILCFILLIVFIYPMLYVIVSSVYFNSVLSLEGYFVVFNDSTVITGFFNSVVYSLVGTLISTLVSILSAYILIQDDFYIGKVFNIILIIAFNFSGGMLTTYLLVKGLGLINTIWAIVLPSAFSFTNIKTLVSRFKSSLSIELKDAALLDGCTHFKYLTRIALPLTCPSIITIAFFSFVSYWSSYFNARLFITDRNKYPLSLVLNELLLQEQGNDSLIAGSSANSVTISIMAEYAVIVLSSAPVMILFVLLSRFMKKVNREGSTK